MSETQWRPIDPRLDREIKRWQHVQTGVHVYIQEYGQGAYKSYITNPEESTLKRLSFGPELPIGPFPNEEIAVAETEGWIFEQGAALVPTGEDKPEKYEE